ncbi:OmpA family protein [Fulvivirga maritima]|uniref:OmpA family protein n=1 Tax=Fulvivirga maritima TaxID=2904247 RepID=UPI001F418415|nr:OmpA family protein [Fulvivirga maritima]UII27084.1 OmpA family protein [Fulvivirga maritima]
MKFFTILIGCLFCFLGSSFAQFHTKSKKAIAYYREADNHRVRAQYKAAEELLQQALKKDDEFQEAYMLLALVYQSTGRLEEAEKQMTHAISLDEKNSLVLFELSKLYLRLGKYHEVLETINSYLASSPTNRNRIRDARKIKENAEFAVQNLNDPSLFNPHPLSDTVNAFPTQYFPIVTVDQNAIIFTRRLGASMDYDEDLVISYKQEDGSWGFAKSLSKNINTDGNEGTCTLSADGRTLIFTSCFGRPGYGSCDLYMSKKIGDEWTDPVNLGPKINSRAWESQPSLSADGRTLYFVSNRHTGDVGHRDIYVSHKDENDEWSSPENLGGAINTIGEKISPFIHPNGVTLYFASNGHTGFGGFDIFSSEKTEDGWTPAKNMGFPINNSEDQLSLYITADGTKGYYSHEDLLVDQRRSILYEFDVPADSRVKYKTSYVKGQVFDAKTKAPINAEIQLFDLKRNKKVSQVSSDSISGDYLMVLTEGAQYGLYVEKSGYLYKSLSFNYEEQTEEPVTMDIYLDPINVGMKVVLNNIFFELDSYQLHNTSSTELNRLIDFLSHNSIIRVEISGHTDDSGSKEYNQNLSLKRAESVYNYLIKNGISSKQLSYKGYGQSSPAYPNTSDKNRQLNRRIEFKVVD